MTTATLTDAAERFPLSSPRGFVPTTEPVSDTAVTPFGLSLRTAPDPNNVAVVCTANGRGLVMATEKATTISDDGQDDGGMRGDVVDD
jgi:hypothetical protein